MKSDPRLDSLLLRWQELRDEGRPVAVVELCADCPELAEALRERVSALAGLEALLSPAMGPSSYLATRADAPTLGSPAPGPAAPAQAGRFLLADEIGRGGMGCVLRAFDPELGRDVAVKVVLPEYGGDAQTVARFLGEARLAGRLQHPGVAPVYDLGRLDDGRPFFAMKLIEGRTLAELLRERHSPGHELPRFLRHFESVCQVVGYAHSRGVIHRDLKPSNVMVGAFGEVQLMDWGLAKTLTRPDVATSGPLVSSGRTSGPLVATQAGAVVGTPAYMAPEQARSEVVDERVDVFGLGAILCEVLTGAPPFEAQSALDTLLLVAEGRLEGAFVRLDGCGADAELVRLAKQCLAPAKEDRPGSGSAVAEWVAAYLAGVQDRLRQAELGRAQAQARAEGERRRRRLAVGLAGAVVLVLLAGGAAAWLWKSRRDEARQREHERQAEERQRQREASQKALLALEQGRPRLDEAWREHDLARLKEVKADADRAAEVAEVADEGARQQAADFRALAGRRLARAAKNRALMAALLDVSAPTEVKKYKADESGRMVLAEPSVDEQYAGAFQRWGLDVDRTPADQAAARLRDEPAVVLQEVVAGLDGWMLERRSKMRPEAEWRRLRRLADRLDENQTSRQLRALLAGEAGPEAGAAASLAGALAGLAAPWPALSEGQRGQRWRLVGLRTQARPEREPVLSVVLMAQALQEVGDVAGAEGLLRRAVASRPNEVVLLDALGRLLEKHERGWYGEVLVLRRGEALGLFRAVRAARPDLGIALARALRNVGKAAEGEAVLRDLVLRHPNQPDIHFELALALDDPKRRAEAEKAYRRVIELRPGHASAHNNLGAELRAQGKAGEAVQAFRRAIELQPDFAGAYNNLGDVLREQKKLDEAVRAHRKAIDLTADLANRAHRKAIDLTAEHNAAGAYDCLGKALRDQKRLDEAVMAFRRAIELTPKADRFSAADAYNNLGIALHEQKRHAEAEKALRRAIQLRPDYATAHTNLGLALRAQKRPAEAEKAYRRAIKLKPDVPEAHNNLGVALLAQKRHAEAEKAYRQAIALRPDFAPAYNNLGIALYAQKQLEEAVKAHRKAIEIQPDFAEAYNNLGNVLRRLKRPAEAETAFRRVIQLRPDDPEAHFDLGIVLAEQKKLDAAVRAWRKAGALRPDHAPTYFNLGLALLHQKKLEEAVKSFRKAIQLRPNFASAYYNLGNAQRDQRKPGEAVKAFRKAIELRPNDGEAYSGLGAALHDLKKLDEAVAAYRRATELRPDYAEAHNNLGNILMIDLNRPAEAEQAYRRAIEHRPDMAFIHHNLGHALYAQKKLAEAERAYRKAIELQPDFAGAYYNLGIALHAQKKLGEAEKAYHKAIHLQPDHAFAHFYLGNALVLQKKLDEAVKVIRQAVKLQPGNPTFRDSLRRAEQWLQFDRKLPAYLENKARPAGPQEALELAAFCASYHERPRTALRFCLDAFAEQPGLADHVGAQHCYNAACFATLAAAGKGKDAAPLPEEARAGLRLLAFAWLRADLEAYRALEKEPKARLFVRQRLVLALTDADLASVRDPAALAALPEGERASWRRLWAEAQALRKRAQAVP